MWCDFGCPLVVNIWYSAASTAASHTANRYSTTQGFTAKVPLAAWPDANASAASLSVSGSNDASLT